MSRVLEDRPWGSLGMTSARWLEILPTALPIEELSFAQGHLRIDALLAIATGSHRPIGGDPLPHVVRYAGRLYVEDGHHRVVASLLAGAREVIARVVVHDEYVAEGGKTLASA